MRDTSEDEVCTGDSFGEEGTSTQSGKESGLLLSMLFPYNVNYVNLHQGWLMAEELVS